jgi:hypothetical protein
MASRSHKFQRLDSFRKDETPPTIIQHEGVVQPSLKPTRRRQKVGNVERWAPLTVAAITTAFSATLAGLNWAHHTLPDTSVLYRVANDHRATVQVVVSILASILSFLWTYAVTTCLNLYLREFLSKRRTPLNHLRLYICMAGFSVKFILPAPLLVLAILWVTFGSLPQWFWTGALTPQEVTIYIPSNISIPTTGGNNDSYAFLQPMAVKNPAVTPNCTLAPQNNGTFSSCPGIDFSGYIVDSMRTASTPPGVSRNHTKVDFTGYNYVNRSYGTGAPVGLFDLPAFGAVTGYNYSEISYLTNVTCMYNTSAAWGFTGPWTWAGNAQSSEPVVWLATGNRPNDNWTESSNETYYAAWAFMNSSTGIDGANPAAVTALSAGSCCGNQTGTPPFYVSIASGWQNAYLDKMQCELTFTPTLFQVSVSVSNRTIHVQPMGSAEDPEPRGQLREYSVKTLQTVSAVQTTLYSSMLGEALSTSVINNLGSPKHFGSTYPFNNATFPGVENSLEAAMDDILAAYNAFALTQPGGWETANATYHISVLQIGTFGYHVGTFILNVFALLVICAVALWTRFFSQSSAFDFSDPGCLIIGLRNGALAVERTSTWHVMGHEDEDLGHWMGRPRDRRLDKVVLEMDTTLGSAEPPAAVASLRDGSASGSVGWRRTWSSAPDAHDVELRVRKPAQTQSEVVS